MSTKSKPGGLMGAGVLTAIAASLCCITPVLALISGASGVASTFSWMEPLRPYLIGFTVLVLGFAWYQKLKPRTKEEIECDCETDEKPSFWQSKLFLGIVTVFAVVMIAFPYYSSIFYGNSNKEVIVVSSENLVKTGFKIDGMTCTSCEEHIMHAVNEVEGVVSVSADYEEGTTTVEFDNSKTNKETIVDAINETGYTVEGELETAPE
jgi:mercuric ion transport protein